MTPLEVLKAARRRIESPERWTKLADRIGDSWCAIGALRAETPEGMPLYSEAYGALLGAVPDNRMVSEFNDSPSTTHADVLRIFDRAIAKLESAAPGRK